MALPQGIQALSFERNRKWDETASPQLSVVIIGHRRVDLLSRAISSFVASCPGKSWEIVLIVNGASASVRDFATQLRDAEAFPFAFVSVNECRPGAARNAGVRCSRAPLLFFLDDDIECFQDVAAAAVEIFQDAGIQAAGGANLTPPGSGALARATGGVMASVLGAASMRRRYKQCFEGPAHEHSLILCNLVVRRAVFEREKGFAAHMISNEENVLLQRLEEKNGRLWSSPRLAVYHRRRDSWRGLCSQAVKYGSGRAQNLLLLPETASPLYFLPLAFALYLALLPFFLLSTGAAALAPLLAYTVLALLQSLALAAWRRDPAHLLGVAVLPAVHLSYGFGFACALFLWSTKRKKLREHTA